MTQSWNKNQKTIINDYIEAGFNPADFSNPAIDELKMQLAYQAKRNADNLFPYLENYDYEQLDEIRLGLKSKVDITQYTDPKFSAEAMHMKRIELEDQMYKVGKND